jgi:hypothetical protein
MRSVFPDDTLVKFVYVPTLRAGLALARHDPARALVELEPAIPYEGGQGSSSGTISVALYPVYLRAQAHLAAKNTKD